MLTWNIFPKEWNPIFRQIKMEIRLRMYFHNKTFPGDVVQKNRKKLKSKKDSDSRGKDKEKHCRHGKLLKNVKCIKQYFFKRRI